MVTFNSSIKLFKLKSLWYAWGCVLCGLLDAHTWRLCALHSSTNNMCLLKSGFTASCCKSIMQTRHVLHNLPALKLALSVNGMDVVLCSFILVCHYSGSHLWQGKFLAYLYLYDLQFLVEYRLQLVPSTHSCPTSGSAVTLKTGRREVPGSNPSRACRPSRSEFSVVFSETRVNTG